MGHIKTVSAVGQGRRFEIRQRAACASTAAELDSRQSVRGGTVEDDPYRSRASAAFAARGRTHGVDYEYLPWDRNRLTSVQRSGSVPRRRLCTITGRAKAAVFVASCRSGQT